MSDEQQRGCPGIHSGVAGLGLKYYMDNDKKISYRRKNRNKKGIVK